MTKDLIYLVVIIALVVIGPFLTIWALNVLFPALAIPYSFETWAAAFILGSLVKTTVRRS